jgi:glucose-6-phosphate dehydrogenase assembly protein OpcA
VSTTGPLAPEQAGWDGQDVTVATVVSELGRLNVEHFHHEHRHAATRIINLVVTRTGEDVEAGLEGLGWHHPSRTILLRQHDQLRLDAGVGIECWISQQPGETGYCHDQVTLTADERRLLHADSLIAPLLLSDLPVVLWVRDDEPGPAEPRLLPLAEHVVLDSASRDCRQTLTRACELCHRVPVHDLSWARLAHWRARLAAAMDEPDPRRVVDGLTGLRIEYGDGVQASALLLAGWLAARLGWEMQDAQNDGGKWQARLYLPGGTVAELTVERCEAEAHDDEIARVHFESGSDAVELRRGASSHRLRHLFAEALAPTGSFARGYAAAIGAARPLIDA